MKKALGFFFLPVLVAFLFPIFAAGQDKVAVLSDADAKRVIPSSFYFAGQSAETQLRNAAAATVGANRYVLAGLVDTSGYSTEISGKYEGFLITDSPVRIGSRVLATGAYGFGFAQAGKIRIFDLSSKELFAVPTLADADMKRPRPLQMTIEKGALRLYKGRNYVVISAK